MIDGIEVGYATRESVRVKGKTKLQTVRKQVFVSAADLLGLLEKLVSTKMVTGTIRDYKQDTAARPHVITPTSTAAYWDAAHPFFFERDKTKLAPSFLQIGSTRVEKLGLRVETVGPNGEKLNPPKTYPGGVYMASTTGTPPMPETPTADRPLNDPRGLAYPDLKKELRATRTRQKVDDQALAKIVRNVLTGTSATAFDGGPQHDNAAVAVLIAALFVAEPARNRRAMAISLILLDFIETGVTYGQGKTYTWDNSLGGRGPEGSDAASRQKVRRAKLSFAMDRSAQKDQVLLKERPQPLTVLQQKEATVLARWVALAARLHPQDMTSRLKATSDITWTPHKSDPSVSPRWATPTETKFILDAVEPLMKQRCDELTLMLDPEP